MENLIALVNKHQRECTAVGDHGEESALPTLWDALPSIAVVGGQIEIHIQFIFEYSILGNYRRVLAGSRPAVIVNGDMYQKSQIGPKDIVIMGEGQGEGEAIPIL
ncbi:hypothetical protein Vadar_021955 [Vaccinium darrowii]|uniref:Uncharacterized protein n=1 Tax=Vaccinium darrowii TaxID=229202 RepID=A0ACB7YF31_9ERIC|nr:hypothetical protein Vadar_021955 [Vaccinium darrowii]